MPNTTKLPLDTSCRATYADGYVLDETELDDKWPEEREREVEVLDPTTGEPTGEKKIEQYHINILAAIIEKLPEAEHGRMVLFSVFYRDARYDIDWSNMPDNARPIRFRDFKRSLNTATGEQKFWCDGCRMGYQYNDESGKNVKKVEEL